MFHIDLMGRSLLAHRGRPLLFAAATAALCAHPARAQDATQIALEPYEWLQPFTNGCAQTVRLGEYLGSRTSQKWYGGCRFGLAHGPGVLRNDFQYGNEHSISSVPYTFYYGRPSSKDMKWTPSANATNLSIQRGPGRSAREWVAIENAVDKDVREIGGSSQLALMGLRTIEDDRVKTQYYLRVHKYECPTARWDPIEKRVAELHPELDRAQAAQVTAACKEANTRLRRDYGKAREEETYPYMGLSYGFYFGIEEDHEVWPRQGRAYSDTSTSKKTRTLVCPQPTVLASCERLWRSAQQPYRAAIAAMLADYPRLEAADRAALEAKYRPLEDELQARLDAYRARLKQTGGNR